MAIADLRLARNEGDQALEPLRAELAHCQALNVEVQALLVMVQSVTPAVALPYFQALEQHAFEREGERVPVGHRQPS